MNIHKSLARLASRSFTLSDTQGDNLQPSWVPSRGHIPYFSVAATQSTHFFLGRTLNRTELPDHVLSSHLPRSLKMKTETQNFLEKHEFLACS
jgi:hypothetical protein